MVACADVGIAVGTMRVVNDGVKADDWIVVNGLQRARPGAPVDPQRQEKMAKQPGSARFAAKEKAAQSVALKPGSKQVD